MNGAKAGSFVVKLETLYDALLFLLLFGAYMLHGFCDHVDVLAFIGN
jgi:hypothetical protein